MTMQFVFSGAGAELEVNLTKDEMFQSSDIVTHHLTSVMGPIIVITFTTAR